MKKHIIFSLFIGCILMLSASCNKSESTAEVIHNCTGSYVNMNGNTYKVYNYALIENHQNGTQIRIKYTFDDPDYITCELPQTICEMYFEYQDEIFIEEIY